VIVLGIDHHLQCDDEGLKVLISDIVGRERIELVAEEDRPMQHTIARMVAESRGLAWIQIDMTTEQQIKAGIYDKLANRMQVRGYDENGIPVTALRYAPVEDGIREEFWLDKNPRNALSIGSNG
jgi:hypothetical protein